MAGEWGESTIGEIAAPGRNALVGGPFGSDLVSRDYVDVGIPVIRGQNMAEQAISGDFVFVSPHKAKSLAANLAHPGDLIFTGTPPGVGAARGELQSLRLREPTTQPSSPAIRKVAFPESEPSAGRRPNRRASCGSPVAGYPWQA